ncbi:hypothetical protein I8748_20165 [Nostoc sp. CENA67]|uniref:Uncharacterized protein n=1 Tax=Amazonocrinis nigriterrae CENA67 TaxID=2794033 RepID=A0A8J7L8H2_9NOST|nr:hypothetical protein [Amazonocrinis nigriterrae]MBH8564469.1 hypothetical protein [Amazonocrinis nigriterrae CENA67]
MKIAKSILALSLGIGAIINSAPASAIPYNGATIYRATDNGNTVVVFSGSAGSKIQVNLGSSSKSTARIAGSCGEVRISPPSSGDFTGLQVDGTAVNAASLSTQTLPSCVNGSFSEARSSNFKTPTGQVVIVNKTPGSAVAISLPSPSTRTVTINGCGFGLLKPTSSSTLPSSFSVGATNYTLASLPDATNTPYCRSINGSYYGYVPASW